MHYDKWEKSDKRIYTVWCQWNTVLGKWWLKQISGCLGTKIEGEKVLQKKCEESFRNNGNIGYSDCGNCFTCVYYHMSNLKKKNEKPPKLIKLYTLNM